MKSSKSNKHIIALTAALVFTFGIWVGDIVYDQIKAPKIANAECGVGNVKSVTTKGLFNIEVSCASNSAGAE